MGVAINDVILRARYSLSLVTERKWFGYVPFTYTGESAVDAALLAEALRGRAILSIRSDHISSANVVLMRCAKDR